MFIGPFAEEGFQLVETRSGNCGGVDGHDDAGNGWL